MKENSNDFLSFCKPDIKEDEINEVINTLKSGWLSTGPKVKIFEEAFKRYKSSRHVAALHSCTAGLFLSMKVSGITTGDEVITTPLTFCATVNTIIHCGATPVLADINPSTMNIDPNEIENKITEKTKAIIPVHFAGRPCDMDHIVAIAKKYNLLIIEDCAHATEAEYKGKKTGTFGDFGCFSFYATKNLVTGEGGMVITDNEESINKIKVLSLHGMSKGAFKRFSDSGFVHYDVIEAGYKYNMMDIQAALGIHQLNRIEKNWKIRENIWNKYNDELKDLPITLPQVIEKDVKHSYHLYTIQINKDKTGFTRDEFINKMILKGIGVGVHYLSIPEYTYYKSIFNWKPEDYPNAMKVGRETVSLPLTPKLSTIEINKIISAVKQILI